MEIVLFWFGFAIVVGVLAANKGRNGVGWFFLAVVISPLLAGLFALAARDLRREKSALTGYYECPHCAEMVKFKAKICPHCRRELEPTAPQPDHSIRNVPR